MSSSDHRRSWRRSTPVALMVGICVVLISCSSAASTSAPTAPAWLTERAGGGTTTFEVSIRSFNLSGRNLGLPDRLRFADGNELFELTFTPETGLGPDINGAGCMDCHDNNARMAQPLKSGRLTESGAVVHVSVPGLSVTGGPKPMPGFGTRIATGSLVGQPEAAVDIEWETSTFTYPDGSSTDLRSPVVTLAETRSALPDDYLWSLRTPQQVAGPGLVEAIASADILAAADPDDLDGDGISGEVNWVVSQDGTNEIGRFGWKAEVATLVDQTAGALAEDIGIHSPNYPGEGPIELSPEGVADTAFYVQGLAIPAIRDVNQPDVIVGAQQFESIGCTSCHTPQHTTGVVEIQGLSNEVIHAFTDVLLHDMGEGLADGRPVFEASGSEWRTAPLWGLGLLELVNGNLSLLHDGRAQSIEEAILWHDGEARAARDKFAALPKDKRATLLRFLNAL